MSKPVDDFTDAMREKLDLRCDTYLLAMEIDGVMRYICSSEVAGRGLAEWVCTYIDVCWQENAQDGETEEPPYKTD